MHLLFICLLLETSLLYSVKGTDIETCAIKDDCVLADFHHCLTTNGVEKTKFVVRNLESDQYNELNKQWNLRLPKVYPRAYFLPTSTQDVAQAVKCGVKTKIGVIPKSGGNSYESISFGTDDQIVIDFRHLDGIRVEKENGQGVAYLEPGAVNGQINAHLWEHGGYALAMGACLPIAVGGHIIGGGTGWYSGIYGLASDNLLHAEVVDASGNIVQVNDTSNPDLFWALRGSGPGYIGILTRAKVKLFEAASVKITLVSINYAVKDFQTGYVALQNFQNWLHETNRAVGVLAFTLTNGTVSTFAHQFGCLDNYAICILLISDKYNQTSPPLPPGFAISLIHIEDPKINPESDKVLLEAVTRFFPLPGSISTIPITHLQLVSMVGLAPVILPVPRNGRKPAEIGGIGNYYGEFPVMDEEKIVNFLKLMRRGIDAERYFKAKGFYIKEQFTYDQLASVQDVLDKIPQGNIWILGVAWQGQLRKFARNATAFVHRDISMEIIVHYEGSSDPKYVSPGIDFVYEFYNTMKFMDGGESYQNQPDLDELDFLERYFKENLKMLIDIKTKWDPNNYFVSKLSIPVKSLSE